MANYSTTMARKVRAGDEYVTVGGEKTPLLGLEGYREERSGASWWTTPDGSFSFRIRVEPAMGRARKRMIDMDKAAAAAMGRARKRMIDMDKAAAAARTPRSNFTSLAELAADWK